MTVEKEAQALVSRLKRESESGDLSKKEAARAKEIMDSQHELTRHRTLDMKQLLERKRALDGQKK